MMGIDRKELGNRAEEVVAKWLQDQGARIVARNLRLGHLEVDIVAREGAVIAIVEVRCRGQSSWTSGFSSVDRKKQLLLRRAGERLWNRRYKNDRSAERLRFDVASVSFEGDQPVLEYAKAAF